MRHITLFLAMVLLSTIGVTAQNYMLVSSEKVFLSIEEYNSAMKSLDSLAEQYQTQVDDKYEQVEKLYQSYQLRKTSLSASGRQGYEDAILKAEAEAINFQESLFGDEGELIKKRTELITPIQQRVFKTIEEYAASNGFDMVMDSSSNPILIYSSPKIERTEAIIELLKN